MKRIIGIVGISLLLVVSSVSQLYAQGRLLRRLKEEVEKKAEEEIFGERETPATAPATEEPGRQLPSNTRAGGLDTAAPDVDLSISKAESAFAVKDYKIAKAALREALWGVELEMGKKLLLALPETVASLEPDHSSDKVSSSGEAFVGMMIERIYTGGDDRMLHFNVVNNSAMLSMSSIAAAGAYQQHSDQENLKNIQFQNHRGFIEYDDSSGYSLTVPFGQSSMLILKGINFQSESEFMSAANQFSLEMIKQNLGVQ